MVSEDGRFPGKFAGWQTGKPGNWSTSDSHYFSGQTDRVAEQIPPEEIAAGFQRLVAPPENQGLGQATFAYLGTPEHQAIVDFVEAVRDDPVGNQVLDHDYFLFKQTKKGLVEGPVASYADEDASAEAALRFTMREKGISNASYEVRTFSGMPLEIYRGLR